MLRTSGRGWMVFLVAAAACSSSGNPKPEDDPDDQADEADSSQDEADGADDGSGGGGGSDQAGNGGAGGQGGGGAAGGSGGVNVGMGGAAGGAGGAPSEPAARTTLEPPAGVVVDWRACEPNGNCPSPCPARPARAEHKPKDFTAKDFAGPVFVPDKDFTIVVEAEDLAHSGNWKRVMTNPTTTDGTKFTGSGYLEWQGYAVSGVEEDEAQVHQGNRCDWLVVKYWIRPEDEGLYTWDVRTHNTLADGDNDAWHGRIGQSETVKRLVTGAGENKKFTFERAVQLLYGGTRLSTGLHAIYIQGRSVGYGIDRIVLHQGGRARAAARDATRPTSKPFPAGYFPK